MTSELPSHPPWHALSAEATLERLRSGPGGLSSGEAERRLATHGLNALRPPAVTPWYVILLDQLKSTLVVLLAAAAIAAFLLGDHLEAIAIAAVLLLNTTIGFVLELTARRRMEALVRFEAPRAHVLRDGTVHDVAAAQLVPGDVVALAPGDRVPADARLLAGEALKADEAILTGESVPADKSVAWVGEPRTALPDRQSLVYAGTTLASGNARAVVVATGDATELGRIDALIDAIPAMETPLQRRLEHLGRRLAWIAIAMAGALSLLGLVQGGDVRRVLETAIALAIAAVPEGLPVVATIALSVGLTRMARRHAVVRRLHAVEALGSTTVICTDKTGTLTGGEMTVRELAMLDGTVSITGIGYEPHGAFARAGQPVDPHADEDVALALRIASLSARAQLIEKPAGGWSARGDPTDAALLAAAMKAGLDAAALTADAPLTADIAFTAQRPFTASVHSEPEGPVAYVKGAPEFVLAASSAIRTARGAAALTGEQRARVAAMNEDMARRGMRVIALAVATEDSIRAAAPADFTFVALAGLIDPPAAGVADTIAVFERAGIRTVMLTGDQKLTAAAIASELGLASGGGSIDGAELAAMTDAELAEQVRTCDVFSRVDPAGKLRIVRAFQDNDEIVAVLGDGVNDAAALKRADVGVTMGMRGTDVARGVAAVVLQDDRFATIGVAIEQGRVIYDNIRKFVFYLFSCNLAEVLVLFIASAAGLPLPLLPLQILWLNLVTDTFPALALAVEPAEKDVMSRAPLPPSAGIMSRRFLRGIVSFSALITVSTLVAFAWGLRQSDPGDYAYAVTLSFVTLGLAQAFHLGNARSRDHVLSGERATANRFALAAVALVVVLQWAAVSAPPLAAVLGTTRLGLRDWAVVLPLAAFPALVGQAWRFTHTRRRLRARHATRRGDARSDPATPTRRAETRRSGTARSSDGSARPA